MYYVIFFFGHQAAVRVTDVAVVVKEMVVLDLKENRGPYKNKPE